MKFNVGERVRWKDDAAYLRLTFPGEETGTVVCVHEHPDQEGPTRLDIRFDNGEIMQRLADYRFEHIAPACLGQEIAAERPFSEEQTARLNA